MIPQPLEHVSGVDDSDTSRTIHCNFSANITVGKYLISNAFLDLQWVFHPILAANHGRASGAGSKWRAGRCVLAMRDVKGRRLADSVLHNLRFVAAHSVRMLCKQQLSQKPVGKPPFLRRNSVPDCLRFAIAPYSFTSDPLERHLLETIIART